MKKTSYVTSGLKSLVLAAMLTAMSVVIGIFCKTVLNFAGGLLRITFENLPIIISGILFGPAVGAVCGAGSDLISYLLSAQTYPPNLVVTLGAATVGAVAGVISRYIIKERSTLGIVISTVSAHVVGSMIIKPFGLFAFYEWLVLVRIPLYMVIAPIEAALISMLFKNRAFARFIEKNLPTGGKNRGNPSMTYDEALAYIHSVSSAFCKPGLDRIKALCDRLGNPERELKFIHVGGTNGKGSVCSMLSSVLMSAGLRVGLYTSPYIKEFGERMRVCGENIPKETLVRLTERVKPIADSMDDKPTEFELITAIAFLYFKEANVDCVVLEVGLGGRLDSTNIIEHPLLSVITGIALDHTAILGDTVEKIAYEKAGIIKHGCPLLYGGEDMSAAEVIRSVAKERGSAYRAVDYSKLTVHKSDLTGTEFEYGDEKELSISLLGAYQPRNAAIVVEAVKMLREGGMKISGEALRKGLRSAEWSARFEIISRDPLIIFDGAHNPQGISGAVESIEAYFTEKIYVLSGVLKDKDYYSIAKTLSRVAKRVYTMTPDNPRALSAAEYSEVIRNEGVESISCGSIEEAVLTAREAALADGVPLVCLGSLYTYCDVIKVLSSEKGE